jgi:hypothetical protein
VRLYKQYVRPHLEFSSPAWSPWLQGDIDILEKVQEKAVKMVSGLKGTTYKEKCKELGLQTLEDRRDRQDMTLVHKFLTEKSGTDMFRQMAATGRAGTRQAAGGHGLSVQYARTDPRKYSFAVRAVEKWNLLPDDVKSAPNGAIFRHKMSKL